MMAQTTTTFTVKNVFYSSRSFYGRWRYGSKTFVNTMIAAYRSAYEPPAIEITNEEVFTEVENNYTIELPQEFNNGSGGGEENDLEAETFTATDTYTVKFVPYEFNVVSTVLECTIQYEDGEYIDKIYGPDGSVIVATLLLIDLAIYKTARNTH